MATPSCIYMQTHMLSVSVSGPVCSRRAACKQAGIFFHSRHQLLTFDVVVQTNFVIYQFIAHCIHPWTIPDQHTFSSGAASNVNHRATVIAMTSLTGQSNSTTAFTADEIEENKRRRARQLNEGANLDDRSSELLREELMIEQEAARSHRPIAIKQLDVTVCMVTAVICFLKHLLSLHRDRTHVLEPPPTAHCSRLPRECAWWSVVA